MATDHDVQGKIFFRSDPDRHQFSLRWCELRVGQDLLEWTPQMDFPNALDTIAYGKNIVLKRLVDRGQAALMERVVWWIKGDDAYYCPQCLNVLTPEGSRDQGAHAQLYLRCARCQAIVHIPESAFSLSSP